MNNIKVNSSPDATWQKMCQAAKKVQGFHEISDHMEAGGVDTACTLGVCAERNALFNMITNGETKILRVLAVMSDGKNGVPCGACREFMVQMMEKDYQNVEVMMDYESNKGELTPEWWL